MGPSTVASKVIFCEHYLFSYLFINLFSHPECLLSAYIVSRAHHHRAKIKNSLVSRPTLDIFLNDNDNETGGSGASDIILK